MIYGEGYDKYITSMLQYGKHWMQSDTIRIMLLAIPELTNYIIPFEVSKRLCI